MSIELALLSRVRYRGLEITGSRLRGLLALLAGDVRAGCSTAGLVAGLWPDEQPEHPTKAVQMLVSRARTRLGADTIVNTPTGYRLALGEDEIDASAVLLAAAASERHARAGDHAAALGHAETGLALCDGAGSWVDVPGDPLSALRAARLAPYRSLVRARALALSRLGRRADAVGPLAELIGQSPRDEEVLVELLRCEAATAGPATALARYDAYRRALRDELGSDPGAGPARRAPGTAARHDTRGAPRCPARAEPAARPGRRHRRRGRPAAHLPGRRRSSAPAGWARRGSRTPSAGGPTSASCTSCRWPA